MSLLKFLSPYPFLTLTTYPEWVINDHLGNTRVRFVDKDRNNVIDIVKDDDIKSELIGSYHYYPFGMEMEGHWTMHQGDLYDYQYNGKELENDLGLSWYDYGARWYDPSVARFISVDRFSEKYSFMTTYQYGALNPIKYVDINGDSIKISIGNGQYLYYQPGQEYQGDDKFVANIVNSLNAVNSSEAGAEVIKTLSDSKNNFTVDNVTPKDKEGIGMDALTFKKDDEGGGSILAGRSQDPGSLAHELFHGYQFELGRPNNTTSAEVEAYLFQDVVSLQANIPFGYRTTTKENAMRYQNAHESLLYDGYSEHAYVTTNIFFKYSNHNSAGIYDKTKRQFTLFPNPLIAKFLPALKN